MTIHMIIIQINPGLLLLLLCTCTHTPTNQWL